MRLCRLFLALLFCCWCLVPLYGTDLAHRKSHRERHHAQCAKKWQKYSNNNNKQKQHQYLISSDRKHTQEVFFLYSSANKCSSKKIMTFCSMHIPTRRKKKHMQTRFPFTSSHLYHHCLWVCVCVGVLNLFGRFFPFSSLSLSFCCLSFPIFLYNLINRQCYLRTYIVLFVLSSEGVVELKSFHTKRTKREKV